MSQNVLGAAAPLYQDSYHNLSLHQSRMLLRCCNGLPRSEAGFQELRDLPNCCGAIDCTHFEMDLPPGKISEHWHDRDGACRMIMQAIVDARMRF